MTNTRLLRVVVDLLVASMVGVCAQTTPPWPFSSAEPLPFIPDQARWVGARDVGTGGKWDRCLAFRLEFELAERPRRAVLVCAPFQSLRAFVNGRLVGTAYDEREAAPVVVEISSVLKPGSNTLSARVHCVWRPMVYAQLRVEHRDGTWQDIITDTAWSCQPAVADTDWLAAPGPGPWGAVEDLGSYYRSESGGRWGRDFALLPREVLGRKMAPHNEALRTEWRTGPTVARSTYRGTYRRAEYTRRFRSHLRIDGETGQLVDRDGTPVHLFFTIYNQAGGDGQVLSFPDFDFDRLEKDLTLMEPARVNVYLRQLGWNRLLDAKGAWARVEKQPRGAGLPQFEYVYEIQDYFLDRVQSHGLFVVVEGDFYWSAHPDVVHPPYLSRYHLYPEVAAAQMLATRKIMGRLANRANVLALMIGEEDIILHKDLQNPHQVQAFRDHLRKRYGSVAELKRRWQNGYDYRDTTGFVKRTHGAEFWRGTPSEEVLAPRFNSRRDPYSAIERWDQVSLPIWPRFRSVDDPRIRLFGHKSYNQFTPDEPSWIDFYEMLEEEQLLGMLRTWAPAVKAACPETLLFYSNAQDFTNSWHFLHLFRRAEIPFDVIGVGCHDSGRNVRDIPKWATVRKSIKVVSSYRPYVRSEGSPAEAIASGEGEGGQADQPGEILDYYRGMLFDEIGGGCAWTQTYNWRHISGAHGDLTPSRTPLLEFLAEFLPAVQGQSFSLQRPVPILIARNKNLQHSNRSGLDYGNVRSLAEKVCRLNVPFDIAMDQDLCHGAPAKFKVDTSSYRVIFLPSVAADYPDTVWSVLDDWLKASSLDRPRVLAVGRVDKRSPYLGPRETFHPLLTQWTGMEDYADTVSLQGKQRLLLTPVGKAVPESEEFTVDFGPARPTGIVSGGEPVVLGPDGRPVGARFRYGNGVVYLFGFYLGFAHNNLWGMEPEQLPHSATIPLLEEIVGKAKLARHIRAPGNVRVHVSDDGGMILVRERFGISTEIPCELRLARQRRYSGCDTELLADGYTRFHARLKPYGGLYFKALPE